MRLTCQKFKRGIKMNRILKLSFILIFLLFCISCVSMDVREVNYSIGTANARISVNDYDDAIRVLTRALAIDNQNETALKLRSDCYCYKRDYGKALEDCTVLCDLYGNAEYFLQNAQIKYCLSLYDEAIEDLLRIEPEYFEVSDKIEYWNILANCYARTDRFAESLDYYSKMIQVEKHSAIYYARGIAYFYLQDYEKARDDFIETLNLIRNVPQKDRALIITDDYYYYLGYCELILKNYNSALDNFNKIVEKEEYEDLDSYTAFCRETISGKP